MRFFILYNTLSTHTMVRYRPIPSSANYNLIEIGHNDSSSNYASTIWLDPLERCVGVGELKFDIGIYLRTSMQFAREEGQTLKFFNQLNLANELKDRMRVNMIATIIVTNREKKTELS